MYSLYYGGNKCIHTLSHLSLSQGALEYNYDH